MSKLTYRTPGTGSAIFSLEPPATNTDRTLTLPDESGTLASQGYVDKAEQDAKDYSDGQALGVGQTWQDVSGSRSAGVTYTNSTGRPIFISVWRTTDSRTTTELLVDGQVVALVTAADTSGMQPDALATTVVPNGSTYELGGNGNIGGWWELR